jgi:hypothetical protein
LSRSDTPMWTAEALAALRTRDDFHLRGGDITRLESLTDGAFALALTYLVIAANEVPHSYQDLITAFKQAPAFAASFAVMLPFWYSHVTWSRRFGLEDAWSTVLTGCFIFTMLIFVLPLKIAFAGWFSYLSGGWLPSLTQFTAYEQLRQLFIAYGLGFTLMETCLGGLYLHAWRQRVLLALNQVEQAHTQYTLGRGAVGIGVGLLAVTGALAVPPQYAALTAWSYALLMPLNPLLRRRRDRQLRRLEAGPAR